MQAPSDLFDKYLASGFEPKEAAVYAMIENLDFNIGRILERIDQLGMAENTIVVFTTDNGPNTPRFNSDMRGIKGSVFEGGLRAPCFIRLPGQQEAGRRVDEIAQHVDIFPTLLELCDVPVPNNRPLDGLSLVPLLYGKAISWPNRTLFDINGRVGNDGTPIHEYPGTARTSTHRWVHDGKRAMLFDLRDDPGEKNNVVQEQPALAAELQAAFLEWVREATASTKGNFERFPITLTEGTDLLIPSAFQIGGAKLFGKGWDNDWAMFPTSSAAVTWNLDIPVGGRYEVAVLHTAKAIGGPIVVRVADQYVESNVETIYDPPEVSRRDLIPRWEVPDKDFQPHRLGTLAIPAGAHNLQVSAFPGVEIRAVRLKRVE